jgi:16S rRNA (guanine966-N2)-methyltransferase
MRIISGNFKGKKLHEPKDKETRPLKDLTKESIFNIINHSNKFSVNLNKALVLDLFSGIGSFGIECLSQGAKYVTFIEKYEGVLPILKKNLNNLKSTKNYKIIEKDILDKFDFNELKNHFDIIFLDPPYKEKALEKILISIIENKILKNNGIIIIHRHKKETNKFPKTFRIIDEKKYGISKIIFGSHF